MAKQCLIGKVSDMVKMSQEGSIVTALIASARTHGNRFSEALVVYYVRRIEDGSDIVIERMLKVQVLLIGHL